MKTTCNKICAVLVLGSSPSKCRGVPKGRDTEIAALWYEDFKRVTHRSAIVTKIHAGNNISNTPLIALSGNRLPGFPVVTRKPKIDACQSLKLSCLGKRPPLRPGRENRFSDHLVNRGNPRVSLSRAYGLSRDADNRQYQAGIAVDTD